MEHIDIKLYSFDIFDTLITRKTCTPSGIFAIMQKIINEDKLYDDIDKDIKNNFYKYREYSAKRSSSQKNLLSPQSEHTLNDIYAELRKNHCLTEETANKLKQLEIQTEYDNSLPIKENINKVKLLLQNNKRVVLISDMYLPENTIRSMLVKADKIFENITIYVSGETGKKKSTGELFKWVKNKEGIEYKNWFHTGDSKNSDCVIPKKLGIYTDYYAKSRLDDYETIIFKELSENVNAQLIAGCAKYLKINGEDNELYRFGAGYIGVILYPFISWMLEKSANMGINRLYFILRDGFLMKKAADVLIQKRNLNIKTDYLFASRKSMRASALTSDNKKLYEIFIKHSYPDSNKLCYMANLDLNEIKKELPKKLRDMDNDKNTEAVTASLINNQNLLDKIVERNKENRINAVNYFKQAVDTSDDNFAFIDLNGTGYNANNIAMLMSDFYKSKPVKYLCYMSLGLKIPEINSEFYFYMNISKKYANPSVLLEAIINPEFETTVGYRNENGKYIPILESERPFSEDACNSDFLKGVIDVVKALDEYKINNPDLYFNDINIIDKYLKYISENINKKYSKIIGKKNNIIKFKKITGTKLAPKLDIITLMQFLFKKRPNTKGIINIRKINSNYFVRFLCDIKINLMEYAKEKKEQKRYKKLMKRNTKFEELKITENTVNLCGGGDNEIPN